MFGAYIAGVVIYYAGLVMAGVKMAERNEKFSVIFGTVIVQSFILFLLLYGVFSR